MRFEQRKQTVYSQDLMDRLKRILCSRRQYVWIHV